MSSDMTGTNVGERHQLHLHVQMPGNTENTLILTMKRRTVTVANTADVDAVDDWVSS